MLFREGQPGPTPHREVRKPAGPKEAEREQDRHPVARGLVEVQSMPSEETGDAATQVGGRWAVWIDGIAQRR